MITIIICTRTGVISETLKKNIATTIGCVYELVVLNGGTSIFKAYNQGAEKAAHPILCFVHEDVEFMNQNWGLALATLVNEESIGLVGLAGSMYKSDIPSPWWLLDPPDFEFSFLKHSLTEDQPFWQLPAFKREVLVIDGVFIGCKKELVVNMPFDESCYNGFHFYDLDQSLQIYFSGCKNYVTNEIHLLHQSTGKLNHTWIKNAILFHRKWKSKLPFCLPGQPTPIKRKIDLKLLKEWNILISTNKIGFFYLLRGLLKYIMMGPSLQDLIQVLKISCYNYIYNPHE